MFSNLVFEIICSVRRFNFNLMFLAIRSFDRHFYSFRFQVQFRASFDSIVFCRLVVVRELFAIHKEFLVVCRQSRFFFQFFFDIDQFISRVHHHLNLLSVHCINSNWYFEDFNFDFRSISDAHILDRRTITWQLLVVEFQNLCFRRHAGLFRNLTLEIICGIRKADFNFMFSSIRCFNGHLDGVRLQVEHRASLDSVVLRRPVIIIQLVSFHKQYLVRRFYSRFIFQLPLDIGEVISRVYQHLYLLSIVCVNRDWYFEDFYINFRSVSDSHIFGRFPITWQLLTLKLQDLFGLGHTSLFRNFCLDVVRCV